MNGKGLSDLFRFSYRRFHIEDSPVELVRPASAYLPAVNVR